MTTLGDLRNWIALAQTLDGFKDDIEVVLETPDPMHPGPHFISPRNARSEEIDGQWKLVISTYDND